MRTAEANNAAARHASEQVRLVRLLAARSRSGGNSGSSGGGDPYAVFEHVRRPGADEKGKGKASE